MPGKVVFSIEGDSQKLLAELNRSIAKFEELDAKGRKVNRTGKKSPGIFDKMAKSIGSVVAAGAGLAVVSRQLAKINEEAKAGAAALDAGVPIRKKLAQIGEKASFAKEIAISSGLDFEQAGKVVFEARSAGFTRNEIRELTPGMAKIVDDPSLLYGTVQKIQTQFGASAGDKLQILNKTMRASQTSPTGFQELAPGAVKAAGAFQAIGATDTELLAAASLAATADEPTRAMTQIKAWASEIAKRRKNLIGKGFLESVRIINEEFTVDGVLDTSALALSFKETKAQAIAPVLARNYEILKGLHADIVAAGAAAGTSKSPLQVAGREAEADPVLRVKRRSAMVKAMAQAETEADDLREQAEQDVLTLYRARRRVAMEGLSPIPRALATVGSGIDWITLGAQDVMNVGPVALGASAAERLGSPTGGMGFRNDPNAEQQLLADVQLIVQDLRGAADKLNRAVPTVVNPGEAE